jgi:phage terminase small subunit
MARISLCFASAVDRAQCERVLEMVRTMMPGMKLAYEIARDGKTMTFTCEHADTLTESSATLLIRQLMQKTEIVNQA